MLLKQKNRAVKTQLSVLLVTALLAACQATHIPTVSDKHLKSPVKRTEVVRDIPPIAAGAPVLPAPRLEEKQEVFTVVVSDVPVKELLFSLARDAKVNLDLASGVEGRVTLNAVQQSLPKVLDRISKQLPLRYRLDGDVLSVEPDTPYWRSYTVPYLNMDRDSTSQIGVSTDQSKTTVNNASKVQFWSVLESNLTGIVAQSAAQLKEAMDQAKASMQTEEEKKQSGSSSSSSSSGGSEKSVIVNSVGGVVSVFASERVQQQVLSYLDKVINNASRQVLIEMTIVEVELSDQYQMGVDWQSVVTSSGLSALSNMISTATSGPPVFAVNYRKKKSDVWSYGATLKLLEAYGNVKVLSSPKIMAINNQTALLKVIDENVYFTVEMEIEEATDKKPEKRTFTSTMKTVPVGLVMGVTPQISDSNTITLNIRPSISRITSYTPDPAPRLADSGFDNMVPNVQVREMESLLQVANEQMVIMGGLMQNTSNKTDQGVPLLANLPYVGHLFKQKDEENRKSELVIFLKPTVIKSGGVGMLDGADGAFLSETQDQFNQAPQRKDWRTGITK